MGDSEGTTADTTTLYSKWRERVEAKEHRLCNLRTNYLLEAGKGKETDLPKTLEGINLKTP